MEQIPKITTELANEELKAMYENIEHEIKQLNEEKDKILKLYKPQIEAIDDKIRQKVSQLWELKKTIKQRLTEAVIKFSDSGKMPQITMYDLRKAYKNTDYNIVLQKLAEWWHEYDHSECCRNTCDGECRDCDAHDKHWEEFKRMYHLK